MSQVSESLLELFSQGYGEEVTTSLTSTLHAHVTQSKAMRQQIRLSEQEYCFALGQQAKECSMEELSSWLEGIRAEDMSLALGCALECQEAYDMVERSYGKELRALLHRYATPTRSAEDLYQLLHEKVFVSGPARRGRIWDYSGKGELRNWLRVTAVRLAIDQSRSQKGRRQHELLAIDEDQILRAQGAENLELDFMKRTYRDAFKVAFGSAVDALESEERNLLRQHLVGGLSIDQIGRLHHVHRATAARRLAKVRQRLLLGTRDALMDELKIEQEEFESIMGLIASHLDASFSRLLGSKDETK